MASPHSPGLAATSISVVLLPVMAVVLIAFLIIGLALPVPWIWSVVVDGNLYVRAYNGKNSRWYRAAAQQKAGRITVAGMTKEVTFDLVDGSISDAIDDAYRSSPYLAPMIAERARGATVRIMPRDAGS